MAQDDDRKEEDDTELLRLFQTRKDWRTILRKLLADTKPLPKAPRQFTELPRWQGEILGSLSRKDIYEDVG